MAGGTSGVATSWGGMGVVVGVGGSERPVPGGGACAPGTTVTGAADGGWGCGRWLWLSAGGMIAMPEGMLGKFDGNSNFCADWAALPGGLVENSIGS
jgi:hypothetical protein